MTDQSVRGADTNPVVQIRVRRPLLEAIDTAAKRRGQDRSEWLRAAALASLPDDLREQLDRP